MTLDRSLLNHWTSYLYNFPPVAMKQVAEMKYQYGQPEFWTSLLVTMSQVTQIPLAIIRRIPHISVESAMLAKACWMFATGLD